MESNFISIIPNNISLYLFIPELYLFIYILFFFIFLFFLSIIKFKLKFMLSINLMILFYIQIICNVFLLFFNNISYYYCLFYFSYYSNFLIVLCKFFFLILFFFFLLFLYEYLYVKKIYIIEFIFLLSISILACIFACSANDFLLLYLLLELQNICIYILISLKRQSNFAIEAALKYFIVSTIMMGFFLYGISFCYFGTGITNFFDLELFLWNFSFDLFTLIGVFFICISLLVKIGVPPFYLWVIDVYSALSYFILFYLLVFLKFFYFFILFRLYIIFHDFFFFMTDFFLYVILYCVVITVISALYQTKFKKLFIYSSISNSSFFLFIFLVDLFDSYLYFFYFNCIYAINMLAIYIILTSLNNWSTTLDNIKLSSLVNLFQLNPYITFIFISFLLSLGGLPPFSGFFYKFYFLYFLINSNLFYYFIILFIFYTISIYYYIRFIKLMFLNRNKTVVFLKPVSKVKAFTLVILFWFNLFFIFFQNFLLNIFFECVFY